MNLKGNLEIRKVKAGVTIALHDTAVLSSDRAVAQLSGASCTAAGGTALLLLAACGGLLAAWAPSLLPAAGIR